MDYCDKIFHNSNWSYRISCMKILAQVKNSNALPLIAPIISMFHTINEEHKILNFTNSHKGQI